MYFGAWKYLLLAILVALPFLFPKVRRALPVSSKMLVRETIGTRAVRLLWQCTAFLVWASAVLVTVAVIAWPMEDIHEFLRKEKIRKICAIADVSTSMSGIGIERIKKILHDFVDRRQGDWLCLVAYSGHPGEEGGARVLQPLTPDPALMHRAVDRLQPGMFGAYTASGEGIWTTVFALREKDLQQLEKRNVPVDLGRLRAEMKMGSRQYLRYLTNLLGCRENEVMVFFSDGFYNTGLHPSHAIELASSFCIRMYFGILDPTGATGLSEDTAMKRREELKLAVKKAGGNWFTGKNYDEIEKFYAEVNTIEKKETVVESKSVTQPAYLKFTRYLPFLAGSYILLSVLYIRIRGRKRRQT